MSPREAVVVSFPPVIPQNPYQRLLYEALGARGVRLADDGRFKLGWLWAAKDRVGILHFHWPEGYYRHQEGPRRLRGPLSWIRLGLFSVRLGAARLLGYRIVWTVHQTRPHESEHPLHDRLGVRALSGAAEILLVHDLATADRVRAELPGAAGKLAIVPHGSYVGVYPPGRGREEMRQELGIRADSFVFLCFGHVRAYKDLGLLLEAFKGIEGDHLVLVVAGLPLDQQSADEARSRAARDHRVRPLLRFIPDDGVAELFEASDVAVLPRSDGGTSGALILALSLGLPVIAAGTPTYRDLLGGGEAGWLFAPGDPAALEWALGLAVADRGLLVRKKAAAVALASQLTWSKAADSFVAVLRAPQPADATQPEQGPSGEAVPTGTGAAS